MNKVFSAARLCYQNLIRKHLIQSVQSGLLVSTGDVLAQTVVEKQRIAEVNFLRTSRFFILGIGLVGPALTVWYRFLSRVVTNGTNKTVVLKKVLLDQLIFAPVSTFTFLSALNTLQGSNWNSVKKELHEKYKNILFTGYAVWPFVQLVNFYAVPLKYQVLVVQTVAVFWNTYLSWKTQQKTV